VKRTLWRFTPGKNTVLLRIKLSSGETITYEVNRVPTQLNQHR